MQPILNVQNLTMDFGGIRALDHLSLQVHSGEIVALIGPNGAGKTTFFNCITGIYKPTKGDLLLTPPGKKTKKLNGLKPNKVTEQGLARTFQNIRLFPNMSVLENVMIGRHCRTKSKIFGAIFRGPRTRREEEEIVEKSLEILKKINLDKMADEYAKNLPYGAQRRLEIARALAINPKFILLDEPFAGVDPIAVRDIQEIVAKLKFKNIGILITDHNVQETLAITDKTYLMFEGGILKEGTPQELAEDETVRRVYLGKDFELKKKKFSS